MKKKFLFICFLLIFVSTSFTGLIANIYILDTYKLSMYKTLSSQGEVLKNFLNESKSTETNLYQLARTFSNRTGTRITFLTPEGEHLADSHDNSVIFYSLKEDFKFKDYERKNKYFILNDLEKKVKVMKVFTSPLRYQENFIIISLSKEMEEYYQFEKNVFFIILASILISGMMSIPFTLISVHKITSPILQEIKEKAQNMESILNGVSEGIILLDKDENIIEINRAAKNFLNYDEKNKNFLFYENNLNLIKESLKISKFPIRDLSQRLILVIEDVSQIKKLEKIKKEFVTNASHELKTPLTIISGFLETISLKNYQSQEQLFYFINIIEKEVEKLKKLTENLLALTTRENPYSIDIKPQILNASEFGNKIIENFKFFAEKKNIKLKFFYKEKFFTLPFGERCLEIVISNLLENAIKYTPEYGNVTLSLVADENFLLVHVEDDGIGISEDDIQKIFEKFYRVDPSRSHQIEGIGLGLSIVKHIVNMLEGEIKVISSLEKGSKFTVKIKLLNKIEG